MSSTDENTKEEQVQPSPAVVEEDNNSNGSSNAVPTIRMSRSFDNSRFPNDAPRENQIESIGAEDEATDDAGTMELSYSNSTDNPSNDVLQINRSFSEGDLDAASKKDHPIEPMGRRASTMTDLASSISAVSRVSTTVESVASGEIIMPKDESNKDLAVPTSTDLASSISAVSRVSTTVESVASGEIIMPKDESNKDLAVPTSIDGGGSGDADDERDSEAISPATSHEDDITATDALDEGVSSSDEESDSEVFLAKEMALAIAKNPNMSPNQLRDLQQQVQEKVEQMQKDRAQAKLQKKSGDNGSGKSSTKSNKKKSSSLGSGSMASLARRASSSGKLVKETLKETKQTIKDTKAAIMETQEGMKEGVKAGAKAGAKVLKKEFKKGMSAMGLGTTSSKKHVVAALNTDVGAGESETAIASPRSSLEDDQKIRLAGIIWKRRSGLGKYSMTASWERRRVVLKGSKLIYYKTLQETMSNNSDAEDEDMGDFSESEGEIETAPSNDFAPANWIHGINAFIDKAGVTVPWETHSSSNVTAKPGARGYMDLKKEKASAAASYGHTGAPTPFALSIKVASITKYKFCFDTQQELMTWLTSITDVVVSGSVDDYNAEILEANNPSSHGGGETTPIGEDSISSSTWQEPPIRNRSTDEGEKQGGHQLWTTEQYLVKSMNYPDSGIEENANVSTGGRDSQALAASAEDYYVDTSGGQEIWGVPMDYLKPFFYLMNAVVLMARFHETLTDNMFWHILVFFDVLAVMVVDKAMTGGTVRLKPELDVKTTKKEKELPDGLQTAASADGTITSAATDELFVPPAGSTSIRINDPKDLPSIDGVIFAGWRQVDPGEIPLRGHAYKSDKKKVPCPGDLYECIDLDVFESRKRYPDMAGRVVLPTPTFENDEGPKTWNAPDLFVISVSLPTDPPKLYGGSADNGGGFTITMYCAMRQKTRDILRRITAEGYNPSDEEKPDDPDKSWVNAARLLDEWCRRAPSDDSWMARFKVIPQGNNLAEIGLPAWISNYNGKPFLIKRPGTTGFLYRHPDKSCMEFDVSLHPFPYLAKQAICYMKDGFFKKILATLAFCIEGRSEDELPECMIGLYQLCYPDPIHAIQAEDFFAGKSARTK